MSKKSMVNNIVSNETLRKIQSETLSFISDVLKNSFGPFGSNACIQKDGALNQYTKDGHTILSNITFNGAIETSIKNDMESITRHIVKTVGDGTTSAIILSDLIFKELIRLEKEENIPPVEIQRMFDKVCADISDRIKKYGRECTLEDIYKISMIATNGNEEVSKTIQSIYKEMGMDVFIDVSAGTGTDSYLKYYDGMTINTGFSDSIYVNNKEKNTCTIDHPEIYYFEHPVDTREMSVYFDAIIAKNIINPVYRANDPDNIDKEIIPTVIICPKFSQDLCGTMDMVIGVQNKMSIANRLPLLIITNTHQTNEIMDLAQMCDAKPIRKYINADIYKEEVKNGRAPTPDTIREWAGHCDQVVADSSKTKFINPCKMYNEDGSKSVEYQNLINFLNSELKIAQESNGNDREIGTLKRRIHSLNSNMVEYFVGGISMADRDSVRDLVEDAVLNCRSASVNGVGYGANFEALRALTDVCSDKDNPLYVKIYNIIRKSYKKLYFTLYENVYLAKNKNDIYYSSIDNGCPLNICTGEFDHSVLTSIESDCIILSTVAKIIGIMATANQFILQNHMYNVYENID